MKIERFPSGENDDEKNKNERKKDEEDEEGKKFPLKQRESLLFAPSFEIEICLCS